MQIILNCCSQHRSDKSSLKKGWVRGCALNRVCSMTTVNTQSWGHPSFVSLRNYGRAASLACAMLENPLDRGGWWATAQGVAQNPARLKRLSTAQLAHSRNLTVSTSVRMGQSHVKPSFVNLRALTLHGRHTNWYLSKLRTCLVSWPGQL